MNEFKRTKIVATLGPASTGEETITHMINAGVNIFRFNTKHGDAAWHKKYIKMVQQLSEKLNTQIGILIDLQGPEIRIETRDGNDVVIKKDEHITFSQSFNSEDYLVIIPQKEAFEVLNIGDEILLDDGQLEFIVTEKFADRVVVKAMGDYVIKHRKGMNLPGKHIMLPSLTESDLKNLDALSECKLNFVALSFSRTKDDIEILRKELSDRNINADIIAKIESRPALDHLDELIDSSDALLVARGDLGIEVPIEELAYWQKHIISKCRQAKKPVITATQMLQSMIENPRPTRAEATDVANAVFDGTDALMLSGETASGKYPIRSVKQMAKIALFSESKNNITQVKILPQNETELIDLAAVGIVENSLHVDIDAFLVFTERGYTARVLSAFRPNIPIIAISRHQKIVEKLTLSYGVNSFHLHFPSGVFNLHKEVTEMLEEKGAISKGQNILIIHGKSWGEPGLTNALSLIKIN